MWHLTSNRLALLELLITGELPRRKKQSEAWEELLRLGWARRTDRYRVLRLSDSCRAQLTSVLDRCWPEWTSEWAALEEEGLTPDEQGVRELNQRRRARDLEQRRFPDRLNQRTATAAIAEHSKASWSRGVADFFAGTELTRDGLVRMRPHEGMLLVSEERSYDACELARLLGEVILTERALASTRLGGPMPRAVLSVENRGPYVDLSAPAGWLVVHVAGWDTYTMRLLSAQLPGIRWLHFGDLDPNGAAIYRHLRRMRPDLEWFVPGFWREFLGKGLAKEWPEGAVLPGDPELVRELAEKGVWLEQEVVAVDPRLVAELEERVSRRRPLLG